MEITYIGHSCFKVKGKNITLVIDPYTQDMVGYKLPKLSADVVLITHNHPDHNNISGVSDHRLVIDGPGEYEIGGVFVYGRGVYHDEKQGEDRGKNTIYLITIDGMDILHVGDLGHELSKEDLEKIPNVDILMVPVGGDVTIDADKAAELVTTLEPAYVLPMHYKTDDFKGTTKLEPVDKFLDVMGVEVQKNVDKLNISSVKDESEETEVVVLKPTH